MDGEQWKAVRNGFLVPVVVLMEIFRERFLTALRRALKKGKLTVAPEQSHEALQERWFGVLVPYLPCQPGCRANAGAVVRL